MELAFIAVSIFVLGLGVGSLVTRKIEKRKTLAELAERDQYINEKATEWGRLIERELLAQFRKQGAELPEDFKYSWM